KLQEENSSEFVGYYTDYNTRNNQFPTIENWCLGAVPDSPFINDWLKEYEKCILSDDPDSYYDNNRELSWEESVLGWKYHGCYFACQLVTRRNQNYRLTLIRADDDAFLYNLGIPVQWNNFNMVEILFVNKAPGSQPKMIKIVSAVRNKIDPFIKKGYHKKNSYWGKML
ncbi:MAG: hypothetical protein LBE82_01160, partial [Chitinophagaceae bacterium]|nr:hypothetical protein [Chitinophagaceae bacterium]